MLTPGLRGWFSHTFSARYPKKQALRLLILSWATAAALLVMVGLAEAGPGEVCSSNPVPVTQANLLTNATTFACASLGPVTIPQIYQLGWRVTQLFPQEVLIDLNNPLNNQVAWTVLIEGP